MIIIKYFLCSCGIGGVIVYWISFLQYLFTILPLTGVEHLLRDVKDTTISTLATEVWFLFPSPSSCFHIPFSFPFSLHIPFFLYSNFSLKRNYTVSKILTSLYVMQVTGKLTALKGLDARLREIRGYLDLVIDEKLPLNHEILYHLQVHY